MPIGYLGYQYLLRPELYRLQKYPRDDPLSLDNGAIDQLTPNGALAISNSHKDCFIYGV